MKWSFGINMIDEIKNAIEKTKCDKKVKWNEINEMNMNDKK